MEKDFADNLSGDDLSGDDALLVDAVIQSRSIPGYGGALMEFCAACATVVGENKDTTVKVSKLGEEVMHRCHDAGFTNAEAVAACFAMIEIMFADFVVGLDLPRIDTELDNFDASKYVEDLLSRFNAN